MQNKIIEIMRLIDVNKYQMKNDNNKVCCNFKKKKKEIINKKRKANKFIITYTFIL